MESLITDVLSPYNVELILSGLTNNHTFYSISITCQFTAMTKKFPLALLYFDLNNEISNHLLGSCKDFNKTRLVKQMIVDILSKDKLNFAHLSAYFKGRANVKFGKFHSVYKLTKKGKEKISLVEYPAQVVHNTDKRSVTCLPEILKLT